MPDLFESPHYGSATFPEPRRFQNIAQEALRQGARDGHRCQMLMSPTGSGKCLGKGTPVLMADGAIKLVENVHPGDRLLGPDGGVRNVLSVASGREMLYRVVPRKGDPYVVNESHILSLKKTPGSGGMFLADRQRIEPDADIVNVNVKVLASSSATARHCLKGWRAGSVEFHTDGQDLLIDPYILGAWLGDGHQNMVAISKPPCRMVDAWKQAAANAGYEVVETRQHEHSCPTWRISSRERSANGAPFNSITSILDHYGLRERKHIPHAYMVAPLGDRLRLLAGMIDSDGHLSVKGFDWISKHEWLANEFAFVCRSVGLAAYVARCEKRIKALNFKGEYWRVSVSGDTDMVPCLDKPATQRRQKKRALVHGITVEPIGEGEYFGFEIDGDHLFLLGDFTVTHNTFLGLRVAHESLLKGRKAMFICDRTTLINQTSAVADSYGLTAHGVIQAQHWRYRPDMPFQIASAQTLARRDWTEPDVVIVDEAHTQMAAWVDRMKSSKCHWIGLSATPFSVGLGRLFTNLVNATTMHDLTQEGVLVPMRVFTCTRANMDGAATAGGEWTDGAAAERGMEIIGSVVSEWMKFGEGRKTICFGATIAHCEEICRQFNEAGVMAAVFCAQTTTAEREEILKEYRKQDSALRVLVSVEALAKGFDVPDVSCVIDCRPLRKSLSTAIQMWGRGLRSSPDTGKTDCILLDHSGNIIRFAKDFEEIFYNGLDALDAGEKLDKAIRREDEEKEEPKCPECGYTPFYKRCMSCGHERKSTNLVEHQPGEMREVMIGKRKLADDQRHLWEQVCAYARGHSAPEKQAGRAWYLFKDMTGQEPPKTWKFESTPNVPVTKAVANFILNKNIAFSAAKKKAAVAA